MNNWISGIAIAIIVITRLSSARIKKERRENGEHI